MVSIKPELVSKYEETPDVVVLLSPVRDQAYLKSLINPLSNVPDAGVGGIDNVFFFEPGHYPGGINSTSAPVREVYLVWFGTPEGTNPNNPQYSIFYAKAHLDKYRPGAPASEWLDPPVLLISWDQISRDIINWFDNVMTNAGIGVSSPGVSNPIDTSSISYIDGYGGVVWNNVPSTITINVTGTPILQQCHFVYDPIDDTILMYFSVMFPNWNPATKTQYVYKFPRSLLTNKQSINQYASNGLTPTTTQTPPPNDKPYFLGGLLLDPNIEKTIAGMIAGYWGATTQLEATPVFTISYDFYELGNLQGYTLENGYLPAIYVSGAGGFWSYVAPAIPNVLFGIILADIHKNPANPTVFYDLYYNCYGCAGAGAGVGYGCTPGSPNCYSIPIMGLLGRVQDFALSLSHIRFGPVIPGKGTDSQGLYVIPVIVSSSVEPYSVSKVTPPSSKIRLLYVSPIFGMVQGYGGLAFAWTRDTLDLPTDPHLGFSSIQITTLPDGKLKFITTTISKSRYYEGNILYVDKDIISTKGKVLVTANSIIMGQTAPGGSYYVIGTGQQGVVTFSFGKKYARLITRINATNFFFARIWTRPQSGSAPDLQQMYGQTPNNIISFGQFNTPVYTPYILPQAYGPNWRDNFGYLIYMVDYSWNMPYDVSIPRSQKILVDGKIIWIMAYRGFGPIYLELFDD